MQIPTYDLTKCSIIYFHTNAVKLRTLNDLFNEGRFELATSISNASMLLSRAIAAKPTFAFIGSMEWNAGLLDLALQLRKYVPETHRIVQLPVKNGDLLNLWEVNANGYLCPDDTEEHIDQCFADVLAGKCYLCPSIRHRLAGSPERESVLLRETLTPQEKKVISLISQGLSTKQIADELFVCTSTIKNHKTNIMQKMGYSSIYKLYSYLKNG